MLKLIQPSRTATLALLCLIAVPGWAQNPAPAANAPLAPVVSAEKNSYKEVTARLDAGGHLLLYLGTERWLANLSARAAGLRELIQGLPDLDETARGNVGRCFDCLGRIVKGSGVEQISGVGMSSIALEPGFYRNRFVLHHYRGQGQGLIWSCFGRGHHPLEALDWLPANTAVAAYGDLDLAPVWELVRKELSQIGIPDIESRVRNFPAEFEKATGLGWDAALGSLGGSAGLVLTLDESRKVSVPLPGGVMLEIAEPALMVVVKVKNDLIFNRLDQLLQGQPNVERVDQAGLKQRSVPVPLPVPLPFKPTIARAGDYLILASHERAVQEWLAVKSGQKPGLKSSEAYTRLAKGLPAEGNALSYAGPALGRALGQILGAMARQEGDQAATAKVFLGLIGARQTTGALEIGGIGDEGWTTVSQGDQDAATQLALSAVVAPTAIMAGMTLPALAQAKSKAQRINCVNNLKQIALAGRLWATDHDDVFPKDFLSMTNELSMPRILICPTDGERAQYSTRNLTWSGFTTNMISYEMVSPGAKDSEAGKVFVRCPIHNNEAMVDGSVQQRGGR